MAQSGSGQPNYPYPAASGPGPVIRFEAIGEAWNLFRQNMGVWILAMLIMLGAVGIVYGVFVGIMFGVIAASAQSNSAGPPLLILVMYPVFILLILVIAAVLMGGLYRMATKQVRGEPIALPDLFSGMSMMPSLIGAMFLVALATVIGSMCFVFPGLVAGGLLMLTFPLIVDQQMGVIPAMQRSVELLKPQWLMATGFYFVLSLVAQLGSVACGIGLLATMPLLYLGVAIVYRDFCLNTGASGSPYGSYPVAPGVGGDVYNPPSNPPQS